MQTTPKPFVFVLMPFSDEFDDVYKLGIRPACDRAGAYCERVDEQIFQESILERIYNQISKADVVVADMTGRNANVFYETGYAHALGKIVVLLTRDSEDIPFDLKHYPHIVYRNSIASLGEDLERRIEWAISSRKSESSQRSHNLRAYYGGAEIHTGSRLQVHGVAVRGFQLHLDLFNADVVGLRTQHLQVALQTPDSFHECRLGSWDASCAPTIAMPDGTVLHVLGEFAALLPQEWRTVDLRVEMTPEVQIADGSSSEVRLRILSELGLREWAFEVQFVSE